MQFRRALGFYVQDEDWFRKVLAPVAWQCVPLLGLAAATGWGLEICRRVIRGDEDELPRMDFRRDVKSGLSVWGISAAYSLPVVLWLGAGSLLSVLLFPEGRGSAPFTFNSFWWGFEFIAAAGLLAAAMGLVAAVGRFAETLSLRAAFDLREIVSAIRSAPVGHLQAVLTGIPLGLLAAAGIAVCGVGVFFTTAFALGSGFHAAGQVHLQAVPQGGPPAAAEEV